MLGRTWGSVVLIATPIGSVSESRTNPFFLDTNNPLECATSIRRVGCDLFYSPPHCRTAAVIHREGCEEAVLVK
jgi:hypothetical protein